MLNLRDPRFGDPQGMWVRTKLIRWELRDIGTEVRCRKCGKKISRFYLEFAAAAVAGDVYCHGCWADRLTLIPPSYLTDEVRKFLDAAEAYLIEKALTA